MQPDKKDKKPVSSGNTRSGYYKAQFERTKANKARRAEQRARKAKKREIWNLAKREQHLDELEAKRVARVEQHIKMVCTPLDPLPVPTAQ